MLAAMSCADEKAKRHRPQLVSNVAVLHMLATHEAIVAKERSNSVPCLYAESSRTVGQWINS